MVSGFTAGRACQRWHRASPRDSCWAPGAAGVAGRRGEQSGRVAVCQTNRPTEAKGIQTGEVPGVAARSRHSWKLAGKARALLAGDPP
jgi:hypothetical protein